ncbi:hypothetical protein TBLA_0F01460 [Henningerozyma blattae CBS 6284]|uniref:Condensin complex subunit 2 n=1 Tax=Henningerozyma blattae (strain ATCC 34711 / CBS 6284 / DSM 70876 / NBRC 10599 / NRRL Y-10934 / UCD 77-7) TaxID=1071380 RepID=I2H5N7_HENB6|nr:hypothetical protein TBLA_0F01460 [Tetrapisispora blattae CBS 6284]CCH61689.1 hypothetical protein TBLA_0F01460 [Tetrapisispora blattae CBS 6284]
MQRLQFSQDGGDNDIDILTDTNMATVQANFDEWLRMSTDNKINSRNSWNFALIDYFYDLNLLKDSENNINFQKASATLDGCVKIYSSRVDSVSNETGKLLSGLAQRNKEKENAATKNGNSNGTSNSTDNTTRGARNGGGDDNRNNNSNNNDDDDDDDDDNIRIDPTTGLIIATENEIVNTKRRTHNRMLETTLVEFNQIKLKELDKELNIDPLFKRALVNFDEGGSKSLLLNTLNINKYARIIFDASMTDLTSTTPKDLTIKKEQELEEAELSKIMNKSDQIDSHSSVINDTSHSNITSKSFILDESIGDTTENFIQDEILQLGMDYLNFNMINTCEISSSIQNLRDTINDTSRVKNFINNINYNNTKPVDTHATSPHENYDNFLSEKELNDAIPDPNDFHDVDEKNFNDYDDDGVDDDVDIGMDNPQDDIDEQQNQTGISNIANTSIVSKPSDVITSMTNVFEQDLMAYFDETLKKTWRGREHWKVTNIKQTILKNNSNSNSKLNAIVEDANGSTNQLTGSNASTARSTKKKQFEEIDFFDIDDNLEDKIFVTRQPKQIEIPQKQRINKSCFLLPDDHHFTTDRITNLFIKPKQKIKVFTTKKLEQQQQQQQPSNEIVENDSRFIEDIGRYNLSSADLNEYNSKDDHNNEIPNDVPAMADEQFWAQEYKDKEQALLDKEKFINGTDIISKDPHNPFDENDNGIDFNQAFVDDIGSGGLGMMDESDNSLPQINKDTELVADEKFQPSQLESNKVAYSRVSKKVDVRKLKNNLWKSIHKIVRNKKSLKETNKKDMEEESNDNSNTTNNTHSNGNTIIIKFTEITYEISKMYPPQLRNDLSTSFCFICLLHLANEHGLKINNAENFEDLIVEYHIKT